MQQRRGTAQQWTDANPTLAAGEIGFETDNNRFKIGDGATAWSALDYFSNSQALTDLLDGAPDALNTLNELAAAINDDPNFFGTVATDLETHRVATGVHGIADTTLLATVTQVDEAISTYNDLTANIHGIADTTQLITATDLTSGLTTTIDAHDVTTNVHGIADTSALATTSDLSTAVGTAASDAASALDNHNLATTNVHGILDTADLATLSDVANAVAESIVEQETLAGVGIDWNSVNEQFDIDSTVATKTYADDAVGTHNSDTTSVHGIADTSLLATTADVAAVTAASLGLGNVDNTSDADKPVSTATVTAIATAKSEAIAEVTAVIDGAPNALNTLNELAAALGDDANFASTVTTSLAAKVDSYTPITQKTASYTLSTLDHRDDLIEMGSSSALTLTIPLNSSIAYPVGTSLDILQTGSGQVTIAGAAGVTVNATPGLKLRTQWSSATLFKRAEDTWVVYGDLTA